MRHSGAKILFWGLFPLLALGILLTLSYPTGDPQSPTVTPETPTPVEIAVTTPQPIEEITPPPPTSAQEKEQTAFPATIRSPQNPPPPESPRTLLPRQNAPALPPIPLLPPQPHLTENPIAPAVVQEDEVPMPTGRPTVDEPPNSAPAVYDSSQVDSLPHPKTPISPVFPLRARRDGVSGSVLLEFVVDATGAPRDIRVLSATPPGYFEQAALHAIAHTTFDPASQNASPVPCRVTLPLVFQLQE